ncbi:secreted and transmembrane protein 1A-like [Thomomys bottae]
MACRHQWPPQALLAERAACLMRAPSLALELQGRSPCTRSCVSMSPAHRPAQLSSGLQGQNAVGSRGSSVSQDSGSLGLHPLAMQTCPVSTLLRVLLLLAASSRAQNERWDEPACTQGKVSVSRGQRAVMTCNISNPFTHITLRLSGPRENRTVFSVDLPPGGSWVSSQDGWQLLVQGGRAQLVVEPAQDSHAGLYSWRLHGHQLNHRSVFLSVLGSQEQSQTPSPGPSRPPLGSKTTRAGPETQPWLAVLCVTLVLGSQG